MRYDNDRGEDGNDDNHNHNDNNSDNDNDNDNDNNNNNSDNDNYDGNHGIPRHLANDIRRGFVNIADVEEDDEITHTEQKLRLGSALTAAMWITLMVTIIQFAPDESYEIPTGIDRDGHLLTALLIFVVTCVRILQMFMKERSAGFLGSGIVVGTVSVQGIAMISNLLMALLPCPVLYDQVTGQRTHLFRYAEWTALTFLMVFLTDNIDSNRRHLKFQTAICVSFSAVSGMILPLCKALNVWVSVFAVASALFCEIYFLLYHRVVHFYHLRSRRIDKKGGRKQKLVYHTAAEQEQYDIARSSFLLTSICSTAWTVLIVSYVAVCMLPLYVEPQYIPESALSLHSCANEVLSKIWYLNTLLEAYDNIFDVNTRVSHRLEELRRFMSAIWQSSSDTIIFCVTKHPDHISARISPAFVALTGLQIKCESGSDVSILLDIHPQSGTFTIFALDLSKPFSRESALYFRRSFKASEGTQYSFQDSKPYSQDIQNMAALARYIAHARTVDNKLGTNGKDIYADAATAHEICFGREQGGAIRCETKISSLQDGCTVFVVRDISDRIERFEVEKKLIHEQAIRSKDAETNHFTRHEVKNGILASIGLLDHMRDSMKKRLETIRASSPSNNTEFTDPDAGIENTLEELDSTLHDVLDTILDEVMAREIIYGEYKPRKERIDVKEVLSNIRRGSPSLFPIELHPSQFPLLIMDRQLLRHIYRNAVSNACRYGKYNGVVRTVVRYDEDKKVLKMEVVNEPGESHDKLVNLSKEQVSSVFAKGKQLAETRAINNVSKAVNSEPRKESSGNGAWIMRKCAETMNGDCDIRFHTDCTILSFECPAEAVRKEIDGATGESRTFGLPKCTRCVVIEDSQVQRKLLDRMLQNSGLPSAKRIMLGKDSSEIIGFPQKVVEIMRENPEDYILLIVDENLDVVPPNGVDIETVSGSGLVQKLREDLDPQAEKRMLALVRSANDSAKDIELYLNRAHGYLLKEPMKKGTFLEAVKPWWIKRFPNETTHFSREHGGKNDEEVCGPLPDDIRFVLDQINSLSSNPDLGVLARRWSVIREKLQSLKGDLKTMSSSDDVLEVVNDLTSLQASRLPTDYVSEWRALRRKIERLL